MSAHATPRGHLALIAIHQGRGGQLDPETLVQLVHIGWANGRNRHWRLTETGRRALDDANRTAARLRSTP